MHRVILPVAVAALAYFWIRRPGPDQDVPSRVGRWLVDTVGFRSAVGTWESRLREHQSWVAARASAGLPRAQVPPPRLICTFGWALGVTCGNAALEDVANRVRSLWYNSHLYLVRGKRDELVSEFASLARALVGSPWAMLWPSDDTYRRDLVFSLIALRDGLSDKTGLVFPPCGFTDRVIRRSPFCERLSS